MARTRHLFQLRMFLILAVLSLMILLKPVLITARTEISTDCENKGQELHQFSHLRRIESYAKRRTKTRRLMNVEELNDYPGSGANNRHTPRP
ncbi:hypothetical protein EUTSA_v10019380mg [Eutrema salsugineum]|uniref:Uncharacterized protein n=1 Tax=Eutrema salsugineum TaxID=72664 RepID=V4KKC0_EUTSA|nr:uncharacterized protein LOC18008982 [Eutrema salsugineum]ESQ27708.1 hypothetical protein EUTSA_v10019380mg [Eutrema salsugineum]